MDPLVWIVARNVKVGITDGFVKKNVTVQNIIIIATIVTVVKNVLREPLDWIVARNVKVGITDGFVYKNVTADWIIIVTIALVVRNVLMEPLVWIVVRNVKVGITDDFVYNNVIVHRMNIAIQSTAVYKSIKVCIKHAQLILVYIHIEKK